MSPANETVKEQQRHDRYMALLGDFSRHIEHFCAIHSNRREDADDMMQEVFIMVWENIDGLREDSTPRQVNRWLQRVMRTVFIRHMRKQPRYSTSDLDDAKGLQVEQDDNAELIEELVAHLPAEDHQLMQERFEGYSNKEIAQRHGLKENTLNQRMSRITTKLRDIYIQLYESQPAH